LGFRTVIGAAAELTDWTDAVRRTVLELVIAQAESGEESQDGVAELLLSAGAGDAVAVGGPAQRGGGDDQKSWRRQRSRAVVPGRIGPRV